MANRSDLPCPDIKVGNRVRVTNKIIMKPDHKADGIVTEVKNGKPTNDYISIGVEFDELQGATYYFYPFECEVLDA